MNGQKKVALVIGGSGGIGRAVATMLSENSFDVVLAARNEDNLKTASKDIGQNYVVMDVTDAESIKSGFDEFLQYSDSIDLLVNATGIHTKVKPILRMSATDWDMQSDIHGRGCFLSCQLALKLMRKQKRGSIVNVASIAAQSPVVAGYSAYGAAKAAMVNFTKSLNQEGSRYGVRATAVSPNYVKTALWEGVDMDDELLISPDSVAETVLFLARLQPNVVIEEIVLNTMASYK